MLKFKIIKLSPSKKTIVIFLKIVLFLFGIVVIYFQFNNISFDIKKELTKSLNYGFIGIGCFFMIIRHLLLAIRIHLIATNTFKKHLWDFIKFEYKLLYYELILPIPNIEDVLRFFYLKKKLQKGVFYLINIIVINRILGVVILFFFMLFSFKNIQYFLNKIDSPFDVSIVLALGILAVLILLFFFRKALIIYLNKNKYYRIIKRSNNKYQISTGHLLWGFLMGIFQLLSWSLAVFFILKGVGINADWSFVVAVVPLMLLSFTVPLSYQGLGLPETVLILNGSLFFDENSLIVAGGIHFIIYLTIILLGGCVLLIEKKDGFYMNNQ
jgi:uncharacterized membrane protein YbhN (UPF0104 family)